MSRKPQIAVSQASFIFHKILNSWSEQAEFQGSYRITSTYGCINNPSTVGRPFLHASVVRMDSNADPRIGTYFTLSMHSSFLLFLESYFFN